MTIGDIENTTPEEGREYIVESTPDKKLPETWELQKGDKITCAGKGGGTFPRYWIKTQKRTICLDNSIRVIDAT